jgi:hypothetical protein
VVDGDGVGGDDGEIVDDGNGGNPVDWVYKSVECLIWSLTTGDIISIFASSCAITRMSGYMVPFPFEH